MHRENNKEQVNSGKGMLLGFTVYDFETKQSIALIAPGQEDLDKDGRGDLCDLATITPKGVNNGLVNPHPKTHTRS